jgi:hypothetical protein
MRPLILSFLLLAGVSAVNAADPPVSVKLVAKKTTYAWPVGQKPEEFEKALKETQKALQEKKDAGVPDALIVDFVLRFTNTGKEATEIHLGGDVNTLALELTGPGVVTLAPNVAVTADFRNPKPVTIEPGKSYDMPISRLSDGFRNVTRLLFFTAPGDYTLVATYQLADAEGKKGIILKSEPAKFTVEAPR